VAIDPGHGGLNVGASYGDLKEKDVNMDVAYRLEIMLRASGYRTSLVRVGDYSMAPWHPDERTFVREDIQARADWANREQADILVSIHHNGSTDRSQRGTEVYYNPDRPYGHFSYALADLTQQYLVLKLREVGYETVDRGVKNDALVHGDPANPHSWLLGTNENFAPTLMPGIIGEALFLSNPMEAELLRRDDVRQAIAEAYKLAIDAYFAWLQANYLQ
jgi:N-acetylmuramoyl-L-alanine amidase